MAGDKYSGSGHPSLRQLGEFRLHDVDALRLILRGGSVIDWHRLNLSDDAQTAFFLRNHELDPDDPSDVAYIESVKQQAIGYLRRAMESAPRLGSGHGPVNHAARAD